MRTERCQTTMLTWPKVVQDSGSGAERDRALGTVAVLSRVSGRRPPGRPNAKSGVVQMHGAGAYVGAGRIGGMTHDPSVLPVDCPSLPTTARRTTCSVPPCRGWS